MWVRHPKEHATALHLGKFSEPYRDFGGYNCHGARVDFRIRHEIRLLRDSFSSHPQNSQEQKQDQAAKGTFFSDFFNDASFRSIFWFKKRTTALSMRRQQRWHMGCQMKNFQSDFSGSFKPGTSR